MSFVVSSLHVGQVLQAQSTVTTSPSKRVLETSSITSPKKLKHEGSVQEPIPMDSMPTRLLEIQLTNIKQGGCVLVVTGDPGSPAIHHSLHQCAPCQPNPVIPPSSSLVHTSLSSLSSTSTLLHPHTAPWPGDWASPDAFIMNTGDAEVTIPASHCC